MAKELSIIDGILKSDNLDPFGPVETINDLIGWGVGYADKEVNEDLERLTRGLNMLDSATNESLAIRRELIRIKSEIDATSSGLISLAIIDQLDKILNDLDKRDRMLARIFRQTLDKKHKLEKTRVFTGAFNYASNIIDAALADISAKNPFDDIELPLPEPPRYDSSYNGESLSNYNGEGRFRY